MWPALSALSLALLVSQAHALYFYIDGPSQKCFFEELPKDTLVVGTSLPSLTTGGYLDADLAMLGSYKASQYNEQSRSYISNPDMVGYASTSFTMSNLLTVIYRASS